MIATRTFFSILLLVTLAWLTVSQQPCVQGQEGIVSGWLVATASTSNPVHSPASDCQEQDGSYCSTCHWGCALVLPLEQEGQLIKDPSDLAFINFPPNPTRCRCLPDILRPPQAILA